MIYPVQLISLSLIFWLSASEPLNSCHKQNDCLDWTITRIEGLGCQYEVCVVYNPKKSGCLKGTDDVEGPSHVCTNVNGDDSTAGAKDFCRDDEKFCCGGTNGCNTVEWTERVANDENAEQWCKEWKDDSTWSTDPAYGACGGTINCWTIPANKDTATSVTLFGFKDGKECTMDFTDANPPDTLTINTICPSDGSNCPISNTACPESGICPDGNPGGPAQATIGCIQGNWCAGGNTKECGFSITIPADATCSGGTTPTCATAEERLEDICAICNCDSGAGSLSPPIEVFQPKYEPPPAVVAPPIDVITIPTAVYNAVYYLLVAQIVFGTLFMFKRYLLSKGRRSAYFYDVKQMDDEEMNRLDA